MGSRLKDTFLALIWTSIYHRDMVLAQGFGSPPGFFLGPIVVSSMMGDECESFNTPEFPHQLSQYSPCSTR
jgi:hypothetical protein